MTTEVRLTVWIVSVGHNGKDANAFDAKFVSLYIGSYVQMAFVYCCCFFPFFFFAKLSCYVRRERSMCRSVPMFSFRDKIIYRRQHCRHISTKDNVTAHNVN